MKYTNATIAIIHNILPAPVIFITCIGIMKYANATIEIIHNIILLAPIIITTSIIDVHINNYKH